jgi:hypothetical protein
VVKDDPNASVGQVIVLTVAALVFVALAVRLYRPLFGRHVVEGRPFGWTEAGQRTGRPGGQQLANGDVTLAPPSTSR